MRCLLFPLVACLVVATGCKTKPNPADQVASVPSTQPSVPLSAPTPSASAATAPSAGIAPYAAHTIPAGGAPNGTWTIAFAVEQKAGDLGLDWWGAVAHCSAEHLALCTETQWLRACKADPDFGKLESWTLTADVPGAVVRGGGDGCKERKFVKTGDKSPTRAGVCCERALGITSEDKADEFRELATKKVLAYEAALLEKKAEPLGKLYADKVTYSGNDLARAALIKQHLDEAASTPDSLTYFDHCDVKHAESGASKDLLADCGVVSGAKGKVRGFAERIAFAASDRIFYVGDPKGMKKGEQKERVRSFLPSEH
jgi:hypothetical protein